MTKKQEKELQFQNLLREVGTMSISVEVPIRTWWYVHQKLIAGLNNTESRPVELIDLIKSIGKMLVEKGMMTESEVIKIYKQLKINEVK